MTNVLIGLAVLALIVYRQLQPRPVREQSSARLAAILGIIGVVEVAQATQKVSTNAAAEGIAAVAIGLAIGAGLGVLRGRTVRLWREADGTTWQRGGAVTVGLWLVAIASHLGIDLAVHGVKGASTVTGASILLFVAVSFGIQREVARLRARRLALVPSAPQPPSAPHKPSAPHAPAPTTTSTNTNTTTRQVRL